MRGKATISGISAIISMTCVCLVTALLLPGCKDKTGQTGAPERAQEARNGQQRTDIADENQQGQLVFDMEEVSLFDLSDKVYEVSPYFVQGQMPIYYDRPDTVRPGQYPPFKSARPIHGRISFAAKTVGQSPPPMYHHLAVDESAGTGTGYDRLYFDRNGNGDLADETPLMPLKDPPRAALLPYFPAESQVCFESFKLTFDFGSAGKQTVEVMARLWSQRRNPQLMFFATHARRGEVEIAGAKYNALLGYAYSIGMPFDQPGTVFHLIPKSDPQDRPKWLGADQLKSVHRIGGKYYRFATTPLGDKLFVRPYDGALGTFEVSPGGRDIREVSIQGSLLSQEAVVAVEDGLEYGFPKPTRSSRLPEGDYLPARVTMALGHLQIDVSHNNYADGNPYGGTARPKVYGIKIRADKPYILDLSNKPDVLFASPAKDLRTKLGDELRIMAVLIDPELDIMIRGLDDMTGAKAATIKMADGREFAYKRGRSLDPKVVITRANGEQVAEGVMPFG